MEENRVALLAVLVEDRESVAEVNALLHEFASSIIGRMGLPYREKKLNIISIVLDAPADRINALAGKLGRLPGVTAKAVYSGERKRGSSSGVPVDRATTDRESHI